jgi:hypothetical protein
MVELFRILSELIGLQVVLFPIVEYKYGRIVPPIIPS